MSEEDQSCPTSVVNPTSTDRERDRNIGQWTKRTASHEWCRRNWRDSCLRSWARCCSSLSCNPQCYDGRSIGVIDWEESNRSSRRVSRNAILTSRCIRLRSCPKCLADCQCFVTICSPTTVAVHCRLVWSRPERDDVYGLRTKDIDRDAHWWTSPTVRHRKRERDDCRDPGIRCHILWTRVAWANDVWYVTELREDCRRLVQSDLILHVEIDSDGIWRCTLLSNVPKLRSTVSCRVCTPTVEIESARNVEIQANGRQWCRSPRPLRRWCEIHLWDSCVNVLVRISDRDVSGDRDFSCRLWHPDEYALDCNEQWMSTYRLWLWHNVESGFRSWSEYRVLSTGCSLSSNATFRSDVEESFELCPVWYLQASYLSYRASLLHVIPSRNAIRHVVSSPSWQYLSNVDLRIDEKEYWPTNVLTTASHHARRTTKYVSRVPKYRIPVLCPRVPCWIDNRLDVWHLSTCESVALVCTRNDTCRSIDPHGRRCIEYRRPNDIAETQFLTFFRRQGLYGFQIEIVIQMKIIRILSMNQRIQNVVTLTADLQTDFDPIECRRLKEFRWFERSEEITFLLWFRFAMMKSIENETFQEFLTGNTNFHRMFTGTMFTIPRLDQGNIQSTTHVNRTKIEGTWSPELCNAASGVVRVQR